MCVSVIPVPLDLAEASRLATSAVGSSSSDAPPVPGAAPEPRPPQWVMRDVQWVECPCRQQWKCAHAGSLLWVVLLWCVARYSAHIDKSSSTRQPAIAGGCSSIRAWLPRAEHGHTAVLGARLLADPLRLGTAPRRRAGLASAEQRTQLRALPRSKTCARFVFHRAAPEVARGVQRGPPPRRHLERGERRAHRDGCQHVPVRERRRVPPRRWRCHPPAGARVGWNGYGRPPGSVRSCRYDLARRKG
ncbi:hypothetical protein T492DRAFT_1038872, partial [Pavlovales sp. CCMP2436]